jgi:hypothetical protein
VSVRQPEGIVSANVADSILCRDTIPLANSGAGWAGTSVPMENIQRFINLQLAAIKRTDPKVLTTLGSWSERAQTDEYGYRNYYTDEFVLNSNTNKHKIIVTHKRASCSKMYRAYRLYSSPAYVEQTIYRPSDVLMRTLRLREV